MLTGLREQRGLIQSRGEETMSTGQITKTAIITGGSSGLGLGVARAYVERGGNVVLNGRTESK